MQNGPFSIKGIIEGFYGVYYTFPERDRLIQFLGDHGFNRYYYGPKNDRQHRTRWREPYPSKIMEKFGTTVKLAKENGVQFVYTLGCGVSICYSSSADLRLIEEKFKSFYDIGVWDFGLLLDDISAEFKHDQDKETFTSYAQAHVELCNKVFIYLQALDSSCTLCMCPTDYHGVKPFTAYIAELGEGLHPAVDIMYTGPEICSSQITAKQVRDFGDAVGRQPLIWDNYPVNDLAMQPNLHIGPIKGRSSRIYTEARGYVINTMIQAEASKIPLLTFADYFADPDGYQPEESYLAAVTEVAGEESSWAVRILGENSLSSCLEEQAAPRLTQLVEQFLQNQYSLDLATYLTEIDEACYHIKNRMENLALRNELLPWVEILEHWMWAARRGLTILEDISQDRSYEQPLKWLRESLQEIAAHPKNISGEALKPLVDYVLNAVEKQDRRG